MLELKDVCFARGGKQILDHVNLKIDDKKFVVITGPNGGPERPAHPGRCPGTPARC